MNNESMRSFLSERALNLHKNYLEDCRLKLSIIEKSGYDLAGGRYPELCQSRSLGKARDDILSLSYGIYLHEIYFSSFGRGGEPCSSLKSDYGSTAGFLYALSCAAKRKKGGFLLVFSDGKRVVIGEGGGGYERKFGDPDLAIDLDENVEAALSRLALSRLDKK